jgi:hypothetical protein
MDQGIAMLPVGRLQHVITKMQSLVSDRINYFPRLDLLLQTQQWAHSPARKQGLIYS